MLGPVLFNIFVCDLLFILAKTYFASYADDNNHPLHIKMKYRFIDQITGGTIYPTFSLV